MMSSLRIRCPDPMDANGVSVIGVLRESSVENEQQQRDKRGCRVVLVDVVAWSIESDACPDSQNGSCRSRAEECAKSEASQEYGVCASERSAERGVEEL